MRGRSRRRSRALRLRAGFSVRWMSYACRGGAGGAMRPGGRLLLVARRGRLVHALPSAAGQGITDASLREGGMSDTSKSDAKPRGELTVRTIAMPADTNANGDIFGG